IPPELADIDRRLPPIIISPQAAGNVYCRMGQILTLEIWSRGVPEDSIVSKTMELFQPGTKRLMAVDLGSVNLEERFHTAAAVLDALWAKAQATWLRAIEKAKGDDDRDPVIIVLDEAHNLAPSEPYSKTSQLVRNMLVRIAAEGRKYGL